MSKPLEGVTVLDLTRILAGPWSTQILADFGADVIKVERPLHGDDTRSWGPPYATNPGKIDVPRQSAYFLGVNRGKRSLAVDLKSEEGAKVIRDLAAKADVLVENFKSGDLRRYGLDAETLRSVNPRLVYCSITGFGQSGPRAEQAGYDLLVQGMAGLMSITGQPEGARGAEPMKVGVALVDVLTGLYATIGIISALHERERTGVGRHIDLALFDVCVASLANQAMNWLVGGKVPQRMGNLHPSIAPYQTFPTADGYMILAVGNDRQFAKMCEAIGQPDLATDPRFSTNPERVANRDALATILNDVFVAQNKDHWVALFEGVDVPCGPINTIDEVFADPQAVARGLAKSLPHTSLGTVNSVANPIHFDGASMSAPAGPPLLGEHSETVLREHLNLDTAAIERLVADGAVATWAPESAKAS